MSDDVHVMRAKIREQMSQAQTELAQMVAFQSVHAPQDKLPADCDKMVNWLVHTFTQAGFADVQPYSTSDQSQVVIGHKPGAAGAPTVLLYFHHDVQPVVHPDQWHTVPWTLTPQPDGRWYSRGAADCKGNIAVHLAAIRALGDNLPVTLKIVGEGSEEQGTGGLESFVRDHAESAALLSADAIIVADTGNFRVGLPSLTTSLRGLVNVQVTVNTLQGPLHSGEFGGAAPDALAALIAMLATLHDAHGNTTIGLNNTGVWDGEAYPVNQFRTDARVLDGVHLIGDGAVADLLWQRFAATVIGIDCPRVADAVPAVQGTASALINVRVPPGANPSDAYNAVTARLLAAAPWNVQVCFQQTGVGSPFSASSGGRAHDAMVAAMGEAYGTHAVAIGQGGSIPLCSEFQRKFPNAEIMLLGVEEPKALIHAPNESVDPSEIENMAIVEALFLQKFAEAWSHG